MNLDEQIAKLENEISGMKQVAFQIKVKESLLKKLKKKKQEVDELLKSNQ